MTVAELGPASLDLDGVYAGEPNPLQFHVHVGPVDVDISAYDINVQVRKRLGDPDIALTGIATITDGPGGIFVLTWDGTAIRDLLTECGGTAWTGVWDLELDNGTPETIAAGKFKAKMDVTQ